MSQQPIIESNSSFNPIVNLTYKDKDKKCQKHSCGYLEVIIGPMFSGKTTALYNIYSKCKSKNIHVLVINHSFDNRYDTDNTVVYTHDKLNMPCISTQRLFDISGAPFVFENIDTILINEAQFFEDLVPFVEYLLKNNKKIYVCGLDGDYKRKRFGDILYLIPLCDKVRKLTSICSLCKNGTPGLFSKRITTESGVVVIGTDNYVSVCRKCYEK
jgi:thymidine kinase